MLGFNHITIIVEILIFFVMILYLIFLTLRYKLTHLSSFRNVFLVSIFISTAISVMISINYIITLSTTPPGWMLQTLIAGGLIATILILIAYYKLDTYLFSIAGLETKHYLFRSLAFGFIGAMGLAFVENLVFINFDISNLEISTLFMDGFRLFLYLSVIIYSIYLYVYRLKDLGIKMSVYFGISYLWFLANSITNKFSMEYLLSDWQLIIQLILLNFWIFFILLGFINFKNKTKGGICST